MAADTSVKHYHHLMPNANVLSGTAGAIIAILDACLITGWGLSTVNTLSVSGGIATATISAGSPFIEDMVALVAGATPAGLNGEKRVLSVSGTTFTFDAAGIPDGTATGTITAKIAPAGWAKVFSATNIAVYKPLDPAFSGTYLRVDDTGTTLTRVRGFESMTDVNTGTGPFPTDTQLSGGGYWAKSNAANTTARPWLIVADSMGVHVSIAPHVTYPTKTMAYYYGDTKSLRSGDAWRAMLTCNGGDNSATSSAVSTCLGYAYTAAAGGQGGRFMPRAATGLGAAITADTFGPFCTASGTYSGSPTAAYMQYYTYPNAVDNSLILNEVWVGTSGSLRGTIPGYYHTHQAAAQAFNLRDKVQSTIGATLGRKVIATTTGAPGTSTALGVSFYDITGPWSRQ